MRFHFLIALMLVLAACQGQPTVVPPAQQLPPAYVPPQMVPVQYVVPPMTGAQSTSTTPTLGPVELKVYAYGAKETVSPKPGSPLEYRVAVKQEGSKSPPITNAFDPMILLMEIYNDGTYAIYGTQNVPDIIPSNVILYDPTTETWVTDRGIAQSSIATQRLFVIISFNGKTKVIQKMLNVR